MMKVDVWKKSETQEIAPYGYEHETARNYHFKHQRCYLKNTRTSGLLITKIGSFINERGESCFVTS